MLSKIVTKSGRPRLHWVSRTPAVATAGLVLAFLAPGRVESAPSRLWGELGEQRDPRGRLPDFSYAGYRAGREPLPDLPVVTNVLDFGAVGDGVTDDTAAFEAAIAATIDGALLIPAGRYLIRDVLEVTQDNVVLRGEGPTQTVLYIDRSLTDLNGGVPSASFSWSGGFVRIGRSSPPTLVGEVAVPAVRGDRWLELETAAGVEVGDLVMVRQTDDADGSLGRHMHNEQEEAQRCNDGTVVFNWRARVVQVDVENDRIELDDPLPIDVRPQWGANVEILHYLSNSGIEDLGIEFPETTYPGHLNELGYNAIQFNPVVDAWARNIAITNADSGIFVSGKHVTLQDIQFHSERPTDASGNQGHHAIGSSQSGLVTGATFDAKYVHSITVSNQAARNVFANVGGSAVVTLDHHRRTPIENLFTDFAVTWNYRSGGSGCEGPHSGARSTYWGMQGPVSPPCNVGGSGQCWGHIQSNVVGELAMDELLTEDREWYENVADLTPRNLYEAQLARRLAIEDRDATFSPLRFGVRSEWDENDRFRWAVMPHDGDERYFLATTTHSFKDGERLGEHALAHTPDLGDVTITALAKTFEGPSNTRADICLIVGYQDDHNYDYAMFNSHAESSAIFAVRDGQRVELANAGRAILTDDAWHTISLRRTGAVLEMLYDDEVVASTADATDVPAPIAGRTGVGTYNDAAWFDDIEIESPDLPDPPDDPDPDPDPDGTTGGTDGGGSPATSGGSSGSAATDTDLPGQDAADEMGDGCSCRQSRSGSPWATSGLMALLLLGARGRRARRRRG